jgi:hypothetical protein
MLAAVRQPQGGLFARTLAVESIRDINHGIGARYEDTAAEVDEAQQVRGLIAGGKVHRSFPCSRSSS